MSEKSCKTCGYVFPIDPKHYPDGICSVCEMKELLKKLRQENAELKSELDKAKQSSAGDSQIGTVGQAEWMEKHGKDRI